MVHIFSRQSTNSAAVHRGHSAECAGEYFPSRARSISHLAFLYLVALVCGRFDFTRFHRLLVYTPDVTRDRAMYIHTRSLTRTYTRRAETTSYTFCQRWAVHAPFAVSFALFCPGGGRKAASAAARTIRADI